MAEGKKGTVRREEEEEEEPTVWVREGRQKVEESLMKAVVMGRGSIPIRSTA